MDQILFATGDKPEIVVDLVGGDLRLTGWERNEFLAESAKMRRCPGIVFADGATGRRARLAGTGLDVWEIIATYQSLNRDRGRLQTAYHWLTEPYLRAALGYYAAYPDEIDQQIARNAALTREGVAKQHPTLVLDDPR